MEVINRYKCSFCGLVYDHEQGAKNCENTHIKINGISRSKYNYNLPYPSAIDVEMNDGSIYKYTISNKVK